MAQNPPVGTLRARLALHPELDPAAVLAVAAQEGLGGGIGDNGTSFGPFQLHQGGALPASIGLGQAHGWAWSPAGIDYALGRISKVAGGLKGRQAINAIVTQFERPADPGKEIAGAVGAYGGVPSSSLATAAGVRSSSNPTPGMSPVSVPPPVDYRAQLLGQLGDARAAGGTPDLGAFYGTLRSALEARNRPARLPAINAPAASPLAAMSPLAAAAGGVGAVRPGGKLVDVPGRFATRAGIELAGGVLPVAEQIAKRFGVRINSGYRSPEHNAEVGGAPHSDHLTGGAVDFTGSPEAMQALYQWALKQRFPYVEPMAQAKDHVHISLARR